MPEPLTPAQQGHLILAMFKHYNVRAGHVLMLQHITTRRNALHLSNEDVAAGLEYCGEQGWIENAPNRAVRLTEEGYAAI